MSGPYHLVVRCLSELKESNLPPIKKLKLEVQLYQLKRLVLMRESASTGGCALRERDFTALHGRIKYACRVNREAGEVNELIKHINTMKEVLAGPLTSIDKVSLAKP